MSNPNKPYSDGAIENKWNFSDQPNKPLDEKGEKISEENKNLDRGNTEAAVKDKLKRNPKAKELIGKIAIGAVAAVATVALAATMIGSSMSGKTDGGASLSAYDNTSVTQSVEEENSINNAEAYDESKDCTKSIDKYNEYNISSPINMESEEKAIEDIGGKISGSWDYATLYAAVFDTDGLGGTPIEKISEASEAEANKNDDFRGRVAATWEDATEKGDVKIITPTTGSFISEQYSFDGNGERHMTGAERRLNGNDGKYLDITGILSSEYKQNEMKMLHISGDVSSVQFTVRGGCGQIGVLVKGSNGNVTSYEDHTSTPGEDEPDPTPEPTIEPEPEIEGKSNTNNFGDYNDSNAETTAEFSDDEQYQQAEEGNSLSGDANEDYNPGSVGPNDNYEASDYAGIDWSK